MVNPVSADQSPAPRSGTSRTTRLKSGDCVPALSGHLNIICFSFYIGLDRIRNQRQIILAILNF
jgi:hypothetical protein